MSKLTEEIKKLSKKLDDIDRRVELIEDKQPKITVKVLSGGDSSVSTSNPKFKVGDRFIPHKPKDENESPTWVRLMDRYDGKTLTVAGISIAGNLRVDVDDDDFYFNPSWCIKVEETKFKKGDWVRSLITGTVGKVEAIYEAGSHSMYWLSTIDGKNFTSHTNQLEPYFPKEGEYIHVAVKCCGKFIAIFDKGLQRSNGFTICAKISCRHEDNICISIWHPLSAVSQIETIRPATAKEKALLDSKLAEMGFKFDGKEIVKDNTPKVGDFCIFWDENHEMAVCDILYEIANSIYFGRDNFWYKNCVKFESEEQFRKIKEGKI